MTHAAQMTDLRKQVLRAIRGCGIGDKSSAEIADAVLAIARPAFIEECASAEEKDGFHFAAARLRALAEKP